MSISLLAGKWSAAVCVVLIGQGLVTAAPPVNKPAPPVRKLQPQKLTELDAGGSPRRVIESAGYRIELNLASQRLGVDAPVSYSDKEPELLPTLAHGIDDSFVSAAVLLNKAKQFDDGLYAAVELAAQHGSGKFAGKKQLLQSVSRALLAQSPGGGSSTLLAAARLGGLKTELSPAVERQVRATLDEFLASPLRSKPLGFYTWSKELTTIFQQDRLLQSELPRAEIEALTRALHGDPTSRSTYEAYVRLIYRLTNPSAQQDLMALVAQPDSAGSIAGQSSVRFFPPSISFETELLKRRVGNQPVPEGFSLMKELIASVRRGELRLTPSEKSGWYDHQAWSLEPLLLPQTTPEAKHVFFTPRYQEHLDELFQGLLALTRETHVKQLEFPAPGAAPAPMKPRPKVFLQPELGAEPLATMYERRAASYRFVRDVLENTFGSQGVSGMHRQTAGGPVEMNLAAELTHIESLFHGASVAVHRQLGLPAPDQSDEARKLDEAAARRFLEWSASLAGDPDVGQDNRMMVPVFYDGQRKLTKVWAVLGWARKDLSVGFAQKPKITITDPQGRVVSGDEGPEVHWQSTWKRAITPVFAEVYVSRLLDRDEFRKHCDKYKTESAILKNLLGAL